MTSRLFFVGARSGCLPSVFALIQIHRKTPITALLTLGFISALYILLGSSIEQLIKYESFVEVSFIGVTIAGLLYLRYKWPKKRRPFRVPLALPITFLIITTFFMSVSLAFSTDESLWGLVLIATGIPVYFFQNKAAENYRTNHIAGNFILMHFICSTVSFYLFFTANIYLFAQKLFIAAPEEDVPQSPRKNPNIEHVPSANNSAVNISLAGDDDEDEDEGDDGVKLADIDDIDCDEETTTLTKTGSSLNHAHFATD